MVLLSYWKQLLLLLFLSNLENCAFIFTRRGFVVIIFTLRICCYYHPARVSCYCCLGLLLFWPSHGLLLLLPLFVSLFSLFISYQVSTSAFFSFVRPTFFVKDIWNILTKDISKLSKLSETFWQKVYQSYQSYLKHFDKRYIKVIKVIWNIVTKDISKLSKLSETFWQKIYQWRQNQSSRRFLR